MMLRHKELLPKFDRNTSLPQANLPGLGMERPDPRKPCTSALVPGSCRESAERLGSNILYIQSTELKAKSGSQTE